MAESPKVSKETYSSIYTARAAAGYLKSFGIDAKPKFLKGKLKVVMYNVKVTTKNKR